MVTGNSSGFLFNGSSGGGIYSSRSTPTLSNCTITGNRAEGHGGGIYVRGSDATVTNSILWGNNAQEGPEIGLREGPFGPASLDISYNDIQGGEEGIYVYGDYTLLWGPGNIEVHPYFVESGCWDPNGTPADANDDFWIDGDYHLLPVSPCIDAGDPDYVAEPNEFDLDGKPRIIGAAIDMGAYEANPIEAKLRMLPRVINRRSRIRYIVAIVRLPEGIERDEIDSDEPLTLYPVEIEAERQYILGGRGRRRRARNVHLLGLFDKARLTAELPVNGSVKVNVIGRLKTGQYFFGTDEIRRI